MKSNGHASKLYNHSIIAVVTSLALLTSTAAHAQFLLATGSVYGGPTTHTETCYLFNAGPSPVTVTAEQIIGENGLSYLPSAITFNTCGIPPVTLPGNKQTANQSNANPICAISVHDDTNQSWACKFETAAPAPYLHGVMDLRDVNNNVLINSNLTANFPTQP